MPFLRELPDAMYLFPLEVNPARMDLQRYIREQKWSVEIINRPELAASPHALYIDYAVHRLHTLATQAPANSELRYRLLWLLDMHWPMVEQLRDTKYPVKTFSAAWYAKNALNSRNAPCEGNLSPAPFATIDTNMPYILGALRRKQSTADRDPLYSLLTKAWPRKHDVDKIGNKINSILGQIRKRKSDESDEPEEIRTGVPIAEYITEWWCLFMLGNYRHCKQAELNPLVRMRFSAMWRRRFLPSDMDPRLSNAVKEYTKTPIVLLYCIKEFLMHAVFCNVHHHASLLEVSLWSLFETKLIKICDMYRTRRFTREGHQASVDVMTAYISCMHTIGVSTSLPVSFYRHLIDSMELEKSPPPDHIDVGKDKEPVIIDPRFNQEHFQKIMFYVFDQQPDLGEFGPVKTDEEEVTQCAEVRPHVLKQFLTCKRIVMFVMHSFGCRRGAIELCTDAIYTHYGSHLGKTKVSDVHTGLYRDWPREYLVFSQIMYAWFKYEAMWTVQLPVGLKEAQLAAIRDRFTLKSAAATAKRAALLGRPVSEAPFIHRRADLYVYCPNCGDHQTMLCQTECKANSFPEQFRGDKCSGTQNVRVDLRTGIPYCNRRKGKNAKVCAETELKHFHTLGLWCVINQHSYLICPQPECGILMETSRAGDAYNQHGIMCAKCKAKWEKMSKKRFDDGHKSLVRMEVKERVRDRKIKAAELRGPKISGKWKERDVSSMKEESAKKMDISGLGIKPELKKLAARITGALLPTALRVVAPAIGTRDTAVSTGEDLARNAREMAGIKRALRDQVTGAKRKKTKMQLEEQAAAAFKESEGGDVVLVGAAGEAAEEETKDSGMLEETPSMRRLREKLEVATNMETLSARWARKTRVARLRGM